MKQITLGSFEVKSGKLMVSDPCYTHNLTGALTVIDDACNGTWTAQVTVDDVSGWGERVVYLRASCDDYKPSLTDICEQLSDLGVDSGQMSIFCLDSYQADGVGEYDDLNSFYGKACSLTLGEYHGGVMPGGCVSRSGFGDGSYSGVVWKDRTGKVQAVQIIFIDDSDEEEEDDFQF